MTAQEIIDAVIGVLALVLVIYSIYLNGKGRHAEAIYNLVFAIWIATEVRHD